MPPAQDAKTPSPLGPASAPFPGPTLHHQPCFPDGAASAILGNAKIVSGILRAGAQNPQLSPG